MTEPSKAAMERAKKICDGDGEPGSGTVFSAFALELDRIDRVAREIEQALAGRHFTGDGYLRSVLLPSIMLPDEPDPLVEVCAAMGLGASSTAAGELRAALEAAGIKIVKDEA